MSECPKCGMIDGARYAHDCGDPLPCGYIELDRPTEMDLAIERECRELGIHPVEWHRRRNQAEKDAAAAANRVWLEQWSAEQGMTP